MSSGRLSTATAVIERSTPRPANFFGTYFALGYGMYTRARLDAAATRDAILDGYQDLLSARVVEFSGDLRKAMKDVKRRDKQDWK